MVNLSEAANLPEVYSLRLITAQPLENQKANRQLKASLTEKTAEERIEDLNAKTSARKREHRNRTRSQTQEIDR